MKRASALFFCESLKNKICTFEKLFKLVHFNFSAYPCPKGCPKN